MKYLVVVLILMVGFLSIRLTETRHQLRSRAYVDLSIVGN